MALRLPYNDYLNDTYYREYCQNNQSNQIDAKAPKSCSKLKSDHFKFVTICAYKFTLFEWTKYCREVVENFIK